MLAVKGGGMVSRERKKDRMRHPWRPAGRSVPFGDEVRWALRTRVREVGCSAGRTIALGEFEFARMEIGLTASGVDRVQLLESMREIAKEWMDQEEAKITGVPREPQPYPELVGVRRQLRLGYGMTLRGEGKRETVKFDVYLCDPIADGASVGAAIERARGWLEERIREESALAQDEKQEEGL